MGKLAVETTATIKASADQVWEVLGNDFVNISKWASAVYASRLNPDSTNKPDGAPVGGRICSTAFGDVVEDIIHFDSDKHEIIWTATAEKLPGFVSDMKNSFSVRQIDGSATEVTSNMSASLTGIMGFFARPVMKRTFSKQMKAALRDLGSIVETGKASDFKQKELDGRGSK